MLFATNAIEERVFVENHTISWFVVRIKIEESRG